MALHSYSGMWMPHDPAKQDLMPTMQTAAPPANWAAADLDDQGWTRMNGPFFASHHGHAYCKEVDDAGYTYFESTTPSLSAICLRGKFRVADVAAAGDMKLSVAYRGGVVVYVNGQEIARANIPDAEKGKGIEALAEDYPREAFVKDDGKIISWGFGDPAKCQAQLRQRIRRLSDVTVPAKVLRKGVNVLAIEAHRVAYHEALKGSNERGKGYELNWCPVGVTNIELRGAGAAANVARPAGMQVWNGEADQRTKATDYGDPCEPLRAIRLTGAKWVL